MKIAAGVDIGGTNSVFGLVTEEGEILSRSSIATTDYPIPEELVKKIAEELSKMIDAANCRKQLIGIGVGAPNGNYFTGRVEFAPNMGWHGVVPLTKLFQNELAVHTVLTNDANAAAIGEMMFGAAKGIRDFLFITLGTGLGSGIVVDGKMVYGHDGFAGEIGHVIMDVNGRKCGCGRKGCLETYCSATGIVKTYVELKVANLGYNSDDFRLENTTKINAKYVYEKALQGEDEALEAFAITGEMLGLALANSVVYTSPQAIFLFGGLAQAGDLLFNPVKESFENNVLNIFQNKIQILPSKLNENDAALLGASSLAFQ